MIQSCEIVYSKCYFSFLPFCCQILSFQFEDADVLAWHLGCPADRTVKLIAIVGNTGDGKSHTLNQAFCGGADVFVTSPSQATCTIGIWAAYLPKEGYLLIDTEGGLQIFFFFVI